MATKKQLDVAAINEESRKTLINQGSSGLRNTKNIIPTRW